MKNKRWVFLRGIWFGFVLLWTHGAWAQAVTLRASVDRNRVEVGEQIEFTVEVEAAQMGGLPTPQVATPEGLQQAGHSSSSSTSISLVNGTLTTKRTTTYVFSFLSQKEGTYVLGPARLTYDGKAIQSDQVRVEVVKASGRPKTRLVPGAGRSMRQQEIRDIEQNLFLRAIPEKQVVYVGEPVGVTYKLFTRYDLRNVQYGHVPTFTGFWAETVFDAQRLNMQRETVNGRAFNAALLKRLALFPTIAGKHTLEQLEVNCEIFAGRRSHGLFDFDPFGAFDTQQVTVRSGDVEIEVKPLPQGAPVGFGGAVGQFEMRAAAVPTTVKAGDPVAVKVVVQGTGNLHAIADLMRPEGAAFKFYDPKTTMETDDTRVRGQKTFEYVAIPQRAGQMTLPRFTLAYFDPVHARYKTAQTRATALRVTPGEQVPQPVAGLQGEEVRAQGSDIRYIKPDRKQLADQSALLYQRRGFWLLQCVPVLGVACTYIYRRHQQHVAGDVAYARRRRSRSEAQRRLGKAKALMNAGEGADFYGEIHRALAQFVADRTNRSAAGLTSEQIGAVLVERGVDEEIIARVQDVFAISDRARFAPGQISTEHKQSLFEQAEDLIRALDRCL